MSSTFSTVPASALDNENDVHVWLCCPQSIRDKDKLAAYKAVLSAQERQRYHRFHSSCDSLSYLVSHALLRHSLSRHSLSKEAGVGAGDWQFSSNAHGKPELTTDVGFPTLKFNLTHTAGLCACVVTLNRACGIDAENVNRNNNLAAVAQRMFAEEELNAFDESRNKNQFYNFWTLREAYVKALGSGLAGSSKDFYFSINDSGITTDIVTASINFRRGQLMQSPHWQFRLFEPTSEHILSVAFESEKSESAKPVSIHIAEYVP